MKKLKPLDIIRGEAQPYTIRLRLESTEDPFDFTGAIEIKVCFPAEDPDVPIEHKLTLATITVVGNSVLGKISGILTTAETPIMAIRKGQSITVLTDFGGGDVKMVKIKNAFNVQDGDCS